MRSTESAIVLRRLAAACVLAGLVMAVPCAAPAADNDTADRIDRKVRVMERVLDEVLAQSSNVYVTPGGAVRGLVLEDYGAVFTIDAGLGLGLSAIQAENLRGVYERVEKAAKGESGDESVFLAPWTTAVAIDDTSQEEKLAGLKSELTDALIDYGATLGELPDDQRVTIAAFLGGHGLFTSSSGTRMVLSVKMGDLRKHNAGQLSRDAVIAKVTIEER